MSESSVKCALACRVRKRFSNVLICKLWQKISITKILQELINKNLGRTDKNVIDEIIQALPATMQTKYKTAKNTDFILSDIKRLHCNTGVIYNNVFYPILKHFRKTIHDYGSK